MHKLQDRLVVVGGVGDQGCALGPCEVAARLHAALSESLDSRDVSGQLYAWANEYARLVLAVAAEGDTVSLHAAFGAIEELLEGELTTDARSFIVMGVLDSLQSMTTHPSARVRSADFVDLLGSATRQEWDRLHIVWGSTDSIAVA